MTEMLLIPSDRAPAQARAEVAAWLHAGSADAALIADARLLVSELVTNCISHARLDGDQALQLTMSLNATTLHVTLHDSGTADTVNRRTPGPERRGGYGLDLVERLSSAWGVERDPHGTTVWFDLDAGAARPK